MPNILVTGGAGFIGSHFIARFSAHHPEYTIINLDKLTYAADLKYLKSLDKSPCYRFVRGDIADRTVVQEIFETYQPEGVINFAAESHVDNSIAAPDAFVQTNIVGTHILLETARKYWQSASYRFLQVSTDEVYGSLGETGHFTEKMPLQPSSPYSASKAAADLLVQSYYQTYDMNTVISRCTNNFGPHQHDEKFIPTIIRKALQNKPIPIYGNGQNKRDWIYVNDHCDAIENVFVNGAKGEVYNIGSNCELRNIELAKSICNMLGVSHGLIKLVNDRPGHDFRYALDAQKIKNQLNWTPKCNFRLSLQATVQWYVDKYRATSCQVHLA